jgi:hypothetical protein
MAEDACADALWRALGESFESEHWERTPLLIHDPNLLPHFEALLTAADLPVLSNVLQARCVDAQVMNEGQRCEPREICWDFLEGGSIILNKIDTLWPPIGRLCAALRRRFLHVFAVMYLTPRSARAVRAHSDDQDVFILQVAGKKTWSVYGSPIELPYANEQLGKREPIDKAALGPPRMVEELRPGSVLYLPRGFVHEAAATESGGSLHLTLTVQTSDLNWSTVVRDGLHELHRTMEGSRLPLALEQELGGYPPSCRPPPRCHAFQHGARGTPPDEVHAGEYRLKAQAGPAVASPSASGAVAAVAANVAEAAEAAEAAGCEGDASAADAQQAEQAGPLLAAEELFRRTAVETSRGFELGMRALRTKLASLNGAQDAAVSAMEAHLGWRLRPSALPGALQCAHGIDMRAVLVSTERARGEEEEPPSRHPSKARLVCTKRGGTLSLELDGCLGPALEWVVGMSGDGRSFAPSDLPGCDAFERAALCYRLLTLGVVHEARRVSEA